MTENRPLGSAIAEATTRQLSLSDLYLEQEALEADRPTSELRALMGSRLAVMRHSWQRGLMIPQRSRSGLLDGDGHRMAQWAAADRGFLGPVFTRLIASALAVGEVNACMGRVVAAPTAGACGVLPAVLFTCAEAKGYGEGALVKALFTAGGIGLAIARLASLSGAEGGCQAEVGSASAMAAGALVELDGGTPKQVGNAVVFALSNVMGLICDPVLGLVEVPCVMRNAMGASNAVLSAELALAGAACHFEPDAVIETMGKVGRRIPEEYRETARGGLAMLYQPKNTSVDGA